MQPLAALHVYRDEPRSAAMNMAIDEALLESVTTPTLRFYRWQNPSLSFGYFGRYSEVADDPRELVRRWTGGGTVPHGDDLTYSFVLPTRAGGKLPPSRTIYAAVHEAIRRALPMNAALATDDAPKISDACFANPVVADVLVAGEKIAGAAQRRTRAGLLHQGSIQYSQLSEGFRDAVAAALCPRFTREKLTPHLLARAAELTACKYGTREWLMRH